MSAPSDSLPDAPAAAAGRRRAEGFTAPFGLARHLAAPVMKLDAVPVLDLCVIALLFSLVFTRFVVLPGVRIDLPDTELRMQHHPAGVAVLTIQNEGMLFFDGAVYDIATVAGGFRSYLERTPSERPVLLVRPQADLSMEAFLRICGMARENGFAEVQVTGEKRVSAPAGAMP
jgi:biopolymer transport protein ExbD